MHTIFEITSNWVWKVASSFWGLKKPILERNRWMQQLIWGDSWDSSWVFLLFAWLMFFVMWVCADDFSPYMGRRTSSTLSLANVASLVEPSGSQSVPQRKKLLKAPSLAELDSSDSDVSPSLSVWEGVSFYFFFLTYYPNCVVKVFVLVIQDEIVGRTSASSSSVATSLMDDTSPESAVGKKSVYIQFHCNLGQL